VNNSAFKGESQRGSTTILESPNLPLANNPNSFGKQQEFVNLCPLCDGCAEVAISLTLPEKKQGKVLQFFSLCVHIAAF